MVLRRRTVIVGAGTAALILSSGLWRVTRLPESAIKPWLPAPPTGDIRLDILRYAILAPNPHNRQPWLIKLVGQDEAILTCDLAKRLPETDPFDRQIVIGFGAFLETARIAASQFGVRLDITPFPSGEPVPNLDERPIARLRFVQDKSIARDPLFAAIPHRHTNRQLFDHGRPVDPALMRNLVTPDDRFATDEADIAPYRAIIVAAITREMTMRRTYMESVQLTRIGAREIDALPDGIALSGPMMEALSMTGQLDRVALADTDSLAFKKGLDLQIASYGSIPALFWIKTKGNSRLHQIDAGRRYVHAQLKAQTHGLAVHPMSQSLQEYPEMAELFAAIHRQTGAMPEERIQMLARVGYASPILPAPRWPLEKMLVS